MAYQGKMARYSYRNLSPALKAAGLAILVVLTRLPFRSHYLFDWDAANFAFSLKQFDIPTHQPHPPGYPLIVGAAQLAHFIFCDANTALVAISIAASAGTLIFLYLLAREIFNETVALAASLSLIFNPVFWFYGEVAAAYAPEALAATAVAYLAYRLSRKQLSPYWLTLGFALAGGVRPNTLLLLSPLYLWALIASRQNFFGWLKQALVFLLAISLWLFPLFRASGGWHNYLLAGRALSASTFSITSIAFLGLEGLWTNTWRFFGWLLGSCGLLLLPAIWQAFRDRRALFEGWRPNAQRAFFWAWILPPAFFYWATHIPKAGYLLTFIAALHLLFMRTTLTLLGKRGALAIITASLAFFVFARPFNASWTQPINAGYIADLLWLRLTAAGIREDDQVLASYLRELRVFSPEDAAFLLDWKYYRNDLGWRVASYYLSDYHIYCLVFEPEIRPSYIYSWRGATPVPLINALRASPVPIDKKIKQLVLISSRLEKIVGRKLPDAKLIGGKEKLIIQPMPGKTLSFAGYDFAKTEISPLQWLYRQSTYPTSTNSYWREPKPSPAAVSTCK
jgi:4-amino-4-deoxy-L-arabinose transferase-like glycosyltransferase